MTRTDAPMDPTARRDRAARARGRGAWRGIAIVATVVVLAALVWAGTALSKRQAIGSAPDRENLPLVIGDWQGDQIAIAATIIEVAQSKGIPTRGQEIAVMVAMGESSLENITFGDDVLNPDGSMSCSLGIYQQQWCLEGESWGTQEQVLDPVHAATQFLDRMVQVPDWETKSPTIVGHEVQINRDAYHYQPYFDDAQLVVSLLTDVKPVS